MREAIAAESKSSNAAVGNHEGAMRQTILLVEDEDMVRGLMSEVLEQRAMKSWRAAIRRKPLN